MAGSIGDSLDEDKIISGGEESAGLSIKGQYSEKDGIPACLLSTEAVATRSTSLSNDVLTGEFEMKTRRDWWSPE
jgi:phosphomannomutase